MKRQIFTLIAALALISTVAYSQVSFGVRAGVNFQNINGKDTDGKKLKNDLKPGFLAGVDVAFPIAQDFYLQPGLFFSTKGASNLAGTNDLKATISYIELPIHLAYKPQLGSGKLILGLGPYFAYGISGKIKLNSDEEDIHFKNDVKSTDEGLFFLKPFDAGADIFFGYEFAFKLSVQLNAQLGLLNLNPKYEGESTDATTKNTGFSLSLGYMF